MSDFVLPTTTPAEAGPWVIENFTVDEHGSKMAAIRGDYVRPGEYTRLRRDKTTIMSDTHMEKYTHLDMLRAATGQVLIHGLGLGMIAESCARKPDVEKVTVIEIDADVISMVAPHLSGNIQVIEADAFTWQPPKRVRYGAVWHDIWDNICADNVEEMKRLHRKYGRRCDWQGSWARAECERLREKDRRMGWY